jgi:hypothetical protein
MVGLAADDHSEADEGAEAAAARRERNRTGDLEGAGNGQRLMLVPGGFDRGAGAGEQHVVEVRIESCLDQQDGGHQAATSIGRSSTIARP